MSDSPKIPAVQRLEREKIFLKSLQDEKLKHKEHRFQLVTIKLAFAASVFGFSALFTGGQGSPHYLLLLVPVICFCTDLYIIADDYKVKRIGRFVRDRQEFFSDAEIEWEKDLEANKQEMRDKAAAANSFILSLSLCLCALLFFCHLSGIFGEPLSIANKRCRLSFEKITGGLMVLGTLGNVVLKFLTIHWSKKKNDGGNVSDQKTGMSLIRKIKQFFRKIKQFWRKP
jgi:hypothetical protein